MIERYLSRCIMAALVYNEMIEDIVSIWSIRFNRR